MKKSTRAVAIIIKGENVLLVWRINHGKEYYVFPGGGVEKGETVEEAVLREVKEESTLEVKIEKLIYQHNYDDDTDQYFYLCSYLSGDPQLGDANEKEAMLNDPDDFYKPIWVKINKLHQLLVYPLEIRDWLIEDVKNNFQNTPRKDMIKIENLRRSL